MIRVTVDGSSFTINPSEITAEQVGTFNRLLQRVTLRRALVDPSTHDLDVIAGLVWLAMPAGTAPEVVFRDLTLDAVCVVELVNEEG